MGELWQSINYKSPAKYYINTYIREYDLSKANISALLYAKYISKDQYDILYNADKFTREREIGLWIREDKTVYEKIQEGIKFAKYQLFKSNDIQDAEVVSIKNDAVFVAGRELAITSFSPFVFKVKNIYNMFLKVADLEIYYGDSVNIKSGLIDTVIDVKGISDNNLKKHSGYFLDVICDLCYRLQRENIQDTLKWLSSFYQDFIERKLDVGYYRSFDSISGYVINTFVMSSSLDYIDSSMLEVIDINRNLLILRELMSITVDIYNRSIK